MNEPLSLLPSALAGVALGLAYLGALWWTVRRLPRSPAPFRLLFVSLVVRMGLLLLAFSLVSLGRWENLLACLGGFVVARAATLRWSPPALPARESLP